MHKDKEVIAKSIGGKVDVLKKGKESVEKKEKKIVGLILEKIDFLSEEEGKDLTKFLENLKNRKVLITVTQVDIDADTGEPSHRIHLKVDPKETNPDDDIRILAGIPIYSRGKFKDLEPAATWKATIEMARALNGLLEEIGVPTATFQNVPVKKIGKISEHQTTPLVLK